MKVRNNLRVYQYYLPSGRSVYLTNRPDRVNPLQLREFVANCDPLVRLQFTDDWVDYKGSTPWQWYLWIPVKGPTLESVLSCLQSMRDWLSRGDIWMHCDSSSMRAPTFLGLYLYVFHPDQFKAIADDVDVWRENDIASSPYEYAKTEFQLNPETKQMLDKWRFEGIESARRYLFELRES